MTLKYRNAPVTKNKCVLGIAKRLVVIETSAHGIGIIHHWNSCDDDKK